MGDGSRLVWPRSVTDRGAGLTSRAGLWWLATVADQLGLTGGLRHAMRRLPWRDHHPGTTVALLVVAIADGATAMSDLAMLRGLRTLFASVASTTTVWRTINQVGPAELRDLTAADWDAVIVRRRPVVFREGDAPLVDVMIGNEEDFTAALGFAVEGMDEHLSGLDPRNFERMIEKAVAAFPNFKAVATTLRSATTATRNDWGAVLFYGGKLFVAAHREGLEIFDRVGGAPALTAVVGDFVAAAAPDPKVDFTRGGKWVASDAAVSKLKKHLVDFMAEAMGGPKAYTGRSMRIAHAGMGITQAQFDALAGHLQAALVKNKVAAPFRTCEFDIIYGEGISFEGDIIDIGSTTGVDIVKKSGTWFAYQDERLGQGKESARKFLREHPAIAAEIGAKIRVHFGVDAKPAPEAGAAKAADVPAVAMVAETPEGTDPLSANPRKKPGVVRARP